MEDVPVENNTRHRRSNSARNHIADNKISQNGMASESMNDSSGSDTQSGRISVKVFLKHYEGYSSCLFIDAVIRCACCCLIKG